MACRHPSKEVMRSCACRRVRPPVASGQARKKGNVQYFSKHFEIFRKPIHIPNSYHLAQNQCSAVFKISSHVSQEAKRQGLGERERERERERDQGKKGNTKTSRGY